MSYVRFPLFTYQRKLQFVSESRHAIHVLKAGHQNANANVKHRAAHRRHRTTIRQTVETPGRIVRIESARVSTHVFGRNR